MAKPPQGDKSYFSFQINVLEIKKKTKRILFVIAKMLDIKRI